MFCLELGNLDKPRICLEKNHPQKKANASFRRSAAPQCSAAPAFSAEGEEWFPGGWGCQRTAGSHRGAKVGRLMAVGLETKSLS